MEGEGASKEHDRHQTFRDNVNLAAKIIFWTIVIGLTWGIAAYSWHLLMPTYWHYLSKDQLSTLQTVLISAIFSSALSGYVNKRMI